MMPFHFQNEIMDHFYDVICFTMYHAAMRLMNQYTWCRPWSMIVLLLLILL